MDNQIKTNDTTNDTNNDTTNLEVNPKAIDKDALTILFFNLSRHYHALIDALTNQQKQISNAKENLDGMYLANWQNLDKDKVNKIRNLRKELLTLLNQLDDDLIDQKNQALKDLKSNIKSNVDII